VDKETLEKWRKLTRRLVEVERRIKELFPLAQPPETKDWEKANFKILTEDQAEELVKLAQEARKLRAEMTRF
jgi:hypothetical protein